MSDNLDDDSECFVTFEQTKEKLDSIERQLAECLGIKDNIRQTLIRLAADNQLEEDRLVQEWHQEYSWYLSYQREEAQDLLALVMAEQVSLQGLGSNELEEISTWAALFYMNTNGCDIRPRPLPNSLRRLLPQNHWLL